MDVTGSIITAGIANAVLLSLAIAFNWRKHPAAAWLCALLALWSLATSAILVQHRLDGIPERIAVAIEHVAAYAAAPTLYFYVRAGLGAAIVRTRLVVHYLPAAVYLLVGVPLNMTGAAEPPPFEVTIGYMMAYTAGSLVVLAKVLAVERFGAKIAWPAAILGMMAAIHVGQLIRLASDSPAVQDIVGIAGAVAVFGLLALALAGLVPWAAAAASRYTRSPASAEELGMAFERMKTALREQELFRRPDLRLADLAEAAGLPPHLASQALSQGGGTSFHELVAEFRVAEAGRLLRDPDNARTAVEPLGMIAGFRSRSSFYEAFQRAVGQTPAEYRRRGAEENRVRSDRSGHGNARA